jgi:hypothetical protein
MKITYTAEIPITIQFDSSILLEEANCRADALAALALKRKVLMTMSEEVQKYLTLVNAEDSGVVPTAPSQHNPNAHADKCMAESEFYLALASNLLQQYINALLKSLGNFDEATQTSINRDVACYQTMSEAAKRQFSGLVDLANASAVLLESEILARMKTAGEKQFKAE